MCGEVAGFAGTDSLITIYSAFHSHPTADLQTIKHSQIINRIEGKEERNIECS